MRYGMPPNSLPSIEPLQLLVLEAVRAALTDAGYLDRPFNRQRTSVVLKPCKRPGQVEGAVQKVGARVASRGVQGHRVSSL